MEGKMRKILAVISVAGLVIMTCGGGGGAGSPEDAVNGMFTALKNADIDAMMQYMPESERETISDEDREMAESMLGMMSDIEFEILNSEVDGDNATVTINFTFMGDTQEQDIDLMKENGRWVVTNGGML